MESAKDNTKTYYVYKLVDPRDNKPFYIGKGCDGRVYHHVKKVKRNSSSLKDNSKNRKIKSILDAGLNVGEVRSDAFLFEEEALLYEKKIIKQIGFKNLTNLTHGGERG